MTKYKVGDVAALFPKPKAPTTDAGKKLQSLFQNFYGKKGKSDFQSNQNKNTENENKETDSNRKSKKNKRKFSAVDDSEVVSEKTSKKIKHSFNEEEIRLNNSESKRENKSTNQDFPRKKKKNQKGKSQNFENNFIKPDIKFNAGHGPESQVASENKNRNKQNKQSLSFIKKSKHQSYKLENNNVGKNNKLSNEEQKDDSMDTEEIREVQQIIKNYKNIQQITKDFSKKSKKAGDKNFQQNSQKKMFNKKEKTYIPNFESKTEGSFTANDSQNNTEESKAMSEDKKVPDFVRRPKKSLVKNEKLKKDKKKSKGMFEVTDNNNNNVDEISTETTFFSEKSKNDKGSVIPDLSSKMPKQPDFIKLPNDTEEDWSTSKPKKDDSWSRTLFIGNLPVKSSKKALRNLFSRFGEIERIKYHGIETDKAKIFSDKGPKPLNPHYVADSVTGYIEFKEKQSAVDALSLRGSLFKGHHITVDFVKPPGTKAVYDKKRSIFIGNLPFDVSDESIWTVFSDCGQIEGVRVVRDRETGISKGIGFVLFTTVKAKQNALALENVKIASNTIRIKEIESGKKNKNKEVSGSSVRKNTYKSKAIRLKKHSENSNSRKSVKKLMKREKNQRSKKQVASILQKAMK